MKKMKKLIGILLSVVMILAMTACGASSTQKEGNNSNDSSEGKEEALQVSAPVSIEFWYTLGGDGEIALQEMITEFNKKMSTESQ